MTAAAYHECWSDEREAAAQKLAEAMVEEEAKRQLAEDARNARAAAAAAAEEVRLRAKPPSTPATSDASSRVSGLSARPRVERLEAKLQQAMDERQRLEKELIRAKELTLIL